MSIRRDYKPATTGQRRQSARRNGLLVMTLILIGLFGGLLAYIKGDRTQAAPAAIVPSSAAAQPSHVPAAPSPPAPSVPAAPPHLVTEPAPARPKYDFYTELPKRRIGVQPETSKPKGTSPVPPPRTQPVADPLRKPAAPRKNATSTNSTVATPARPNAKTASPESTTAKATPARPASTTNPARAAQPIRPPTNDRSKIVVKTE